ncbi:MAG: anhydro-N-acetylmuramic acid kinase [Bacteroidales bacterium]|nr:anhydro-N-acetylmuramic acid kinase [Bacteroidales bacterium]
MKEALAIGLMSGSSLDGIDLVLTRLVDDQGSYRYEILEAETLPYPAPWQERLSNAFHCQPEELKVLDHDYGIYLGQCVRAFIEEHKVHPDFVASHGHTVFHKPKERYTLQVGDGQAIADCCSLLTVNDFRSEDVAKGGQGAPLVPIGDRLLFGDYELCLNIGGIANISYESQEGRIAYDLCIANQALNMLAQRDGLAYDRDGLKARSGKIDESLLKALNSHPFYQQEPPKSLGREFFETYQRSLLEKGDTADLLATFTEHVALQIAQAINSQPQGKLLATGGGAHNTYLLERLRHHTKHQVIVPDAQTVDYKEALIFALLGMLRLEGKVNVLRSVTGAPTDSSSGKIWHSNKSFDNNLV